MRGVCARARLTDRYFYEHFADRDALLVAVWNHARDSVISLLLEAFRTSTEPAPDAQVREAIVELVHELADDDPNGAQLLFSANLGTPVLQQCRQQTLQQLTDVIVTLAAPRLRPGVDLDDLRMSTLMGIGGFIELITAWQSGTITATAEQIIDHTGRITTMLASQYMHPQPTNISHMTRSVLEAMEADTA
jgi:AcrR family transcriptional regulator